MRITKLVVALCLCGAPLAMADDSTPETDSGGKPTTNEPSKADPATKTLPASASATAKANAFGQQGARMKAAHAAAKAAAAGEAQRAAGQVIAAAHRNAHATGHAANANSHAATGLEHAAAHAHPH